MSCGQSQRRRWGVRWFSIDYLIWIVLCSHFSVANANRVSPSRRAVNMLAEFQSRSPPSDHPTTSTVAAANPFRRTAQARTPPLPLPIVSCSIRTSTSRWSGYFRVSTAVLLYLVETNMVAKMRRYFCLKMSCNGQNYLRPQRRIERSIQFSNSQVRYLLQRTSKTTSLYRVAKNRGLILVMRQTYLNKLTSK